VGLLENVGKNLLECITSQPTAALCSLGENVESYTWSVRVEKVQTWQINQKSVVTTH